MTPRTEQQYEEIREGKKNLILDTALELFATEGYYPTSISKIAEQAGISKGLIYNYFKSKEDIIRTIIHKGIDDLFKIFDPNKDGVLTKDEIRYFIEQMFDIMHRDLQFWRLYFMVFVQPPVLKLVEARLSELIQSSLTMLANHFESEGSEEPRIEAILLGAILDGTGFHFVMNPENFPVEKIKEPIT
jgi:AcrR family transcriptional regulator